MRARVRPLFVLLIALAFLGGTIGVAFAFGADPCDETFHNAASGQDGHHHHHDDGESPTCVVCLCCGVIPTLPAASVALGAPQQIAYAFYRQDVPLMAGRSVAPDPAPPRSIA